MSGKFEESEQCHNQKRQNLQTLTVILESISNPSEKRTENADVNGDFVFEKVLPGIIFFL